MFDYQQNNPYGQYFSPRAAYMPRTEVIHVNGKNGADAYIMPPNSSALLLDETSPIVYLAQTDGAGYKTVTAYEIKPYEPQPTPDVTTLEERIARLEAMIVEPDNESYKPKLTDKADVRGGARQRKGAGDDCQE